MGAAPCDGTAKRAEQRRKRIPHGCFGRQKGRVGGDMGCVGRRNDRFATFSYASDALPGAPHRRAGRAKSETRRQAQSSNRSAAYPRSCLADLARTLPSMLVRVASDCSRQPQGLSYGASFASHLLTSGVEDISHELSVKSGTCIKPLFLSSFFPLLQIPSSFPRFRQQHSHHGFRRWCRRCF